MHYYANVLTNETLRSQIINSHMTISSIVIIDIKVNCPLEYMS
jgi:hypothetical protein